MKAKKYHVCSPTRSRKCGHAGESRNQGYTGDSYGRHGNLAWKDCDGSHGDSRGYANVIASNPSILARRVPLLGIGKCQWHEYFTSSIQTSINSQIYIPLSGGKRSVTSAGGMPSPRRGKK